MTVRPQGPLCAAASGFCGSGFFTAGLAGLVGEGFVGDYLAGAGLGAAVGAVCARADCASASASHKATLRITFRSAVSVRLDLQNCNRELVRVKSPRAPNENTGVRGCALRAFSRGSRRSRRGRKAAGRLLRICQSAVDANFKHAATRPPQAHLRRGSPVSGSVPPPHAPPVRSLITAIFDLDLHEFVLSVSIDPARDFIRYRPSGTDKTESAMPARSFTANAR